MKAITYFQAMTVKLPIATIATILLFLSTSYSSAQTLTWAKAMGGNNKDYGNDISVDGSGNVYTTGAFWGTADFDPGTSTYNLTSIGGTDAFISKVDPSGNFVWAVQIGGVSSGTEGRSIATDDFGNVYITGTFWDTIDADPSPNVYHLVSEGNIDGFICKLDAAGNFEWAASFGNWALDEGVSITLDAAGDVYVTGHFGDTVDFDPGPGAFLLNSAEGSIFISKFTSSGGFVRAIQIGNSGNGIVYSMAVDGLSGYIYTTGIFDGSPDFDPGPGTFFLTSAGDYDIFVCKLDTAGNFEWAGQMGGPGPDYGFAIALDLFGNVYTTGLFSGTADFNPGPGTFNMTAAVYTDVYVSKLDASGNFLWAKQMGGSTQTAYGIATDADANVYVTGYFGWAAVDFDPGPGTYSLTPVGSEDVFIWKLDTQGDFGWAVQLGGPNKEIGNSITIDGSGNIYTTGYFAGTVDFDPGPGTHNLTASGFEDVFVHKMSGMVGLDENDPSASLMIYPNPTKEILNIESVEGISFELYDSMGRLLLQSESSNELNLSTFENGIYFIKLQGARGVVMRKIVKQ